MRISEYAVKHPQLTIVLFLMAAALGVCALTSIPLSEDPVFPVSTCTVAAVYPGATPADMEQLVVDKLEARFNSLDGLKSLKTTIEDGLSVTVVEFDASTDPEKKYDEVVREVNALRPQLPQDLYRLDVHKWDLANVNILQVALVSDALPYAELESRARHLKDRLERVPGIRTVDRWAYPAREVSVQLDPGRLAQLHLPASQVVQAIQSDNAIIPGGSADAGARAFSVKTNGGYRDVDQVRGTVVGGNGRAIVTLGDVADVRWSHADLRHIGRWGMAWLAGRGVGHDGALRVILVRDLRRRMGADPGGVSAPALVDVMMAVATNAAPGAKGNGQACFRTVQSMDLYPTLAELCGPHGQHHSEAADQQDGRVDGADGHVQTRAGRRERVRICPAIHRVSSEHTAEEHDLGDEEDPHPQRRGVFLLGFGVELYLKRASQLRPPPRLPCCSRKHRA